MQRVHLGANRIKQRAIGIRSSKPDASIGPSSRTDCKCDASVAIKRCFVVVFLVLGLSTKCVGALQPNEIVIVAARGSRESEGLARYYARVRGVPAENICLVDMPGDEHLPRDKWQWAVRPEIRKWLTEHDPQQRIRCLLTVWGVPLKIGPAAVDDDMKSYQRFLEGERAHRLKLLGDVQQALAKVAPKGELSAANDANRDESTDSATTPAASNASPSTNGDSAPPAASSATPTDTAAATLLAVRQQLEKALQSAQVRLSEISPGDARTRGQIQLQQLAASAGGSLVILQGLNQRVAANPDSLPPELRAEFDLLRGRVSAFNEMRLLFDQAPPSIERDALVLAVMERIGGLLGSVEWLDEQLKTVTQNESGASFDSELALVLWRDDYQLLRWQPNYLRAAYDNSQLGKAYRTFMVARLDAPTLLLAKGLVDTAIKIENEGLRGKVYIDNRGMGKLEDTNVIPGSYADYDRALLALAKGVEEQTELDVVVDTSPQLFRPGTCPNAALYCGWYSLAKYIDAFEWQPGAVAYHLASGEARTLREPASEAWCKKMLEDGICATIGPVYEPYLAAFPRPNEFFALLLQGELTLAECYARTNPYNSWMMTLIGDPLYRPFKYRAPKPLPTEKQ